ncbi:hypothetical protein FRB98_000256, partial [Tulasnella sp. 332]
EVMDLRGLCEALRSPDNPWSTVDEPTCHGRNHCDRLGDDLLHEIMARITAEENAKEDMAEWEERRGGRSSEPDPVQSSPVDMHFPESAAQVCRRWRSIALSSAAIWTRIRIDVYHGPTRTQRWLDRTSRAPTLDLIWRYVNEDGEDSSVDQWDELRDNVEERTACLLPHLHRIVRLSIDLSCAHVMDLPDVLWSMFMTILTRSTSLRTLDLYFFKQYALCRQLNITPNAFPNLRVLTALDSSIPWKALTSRRMVKTNLLKRVELEWIYSEKEDGNEPSWEELQDLLVSSPELEEISLSHIDDFHPRSHLTMEPMRLPLVFHHLHTLKLMACANLCAILLPSLHAPNLIHFSLRFNPIDGFLPSSSLLTLPPSLERLKIASLKSAHDALLSFLHSAPRFLTTLELEGYYEPCPTGASSPFSMELMEATMRCPQLRHLDLWRVYVLADDLTNLVETRAAMKVNIAALQTICLRDAVPPSLVNKLVHLGVEVTVIVMKEDVPGPYGAVAPGVCRDCKCSKLGIYILLVRLTLIVLGYSVLRMTYLYITGSTPNA